MITTLLCTVKTLSWLESALLNSGCILLSAKTETSKGYTVHLEGTYRQVKAFLTLAAEDDALY